MLSRSKHRTRAELYEAAKRLNIPGRSRMNKEELARALAANRWTRLRSWRSVALRRRSRPSRKSGMHRHPRREHRTGVRRATHILSTALITAGLVVLADAILTLTWQEPVSAAYAKIQQSRAEDELEELEAELVTPGVAVQGSDATGRAAALARSFRDRIEPGDAIGRIEIESIGLDSVLMHGTDTGTLQRGPGHYEETALPGQGETAGIAGHRTTYLAPFREINQVENGDEVRLEMPYAAFVYTVEDTETVEPSQVEVIDPVGYERVVLTACHPLYSAAQRYVVFARLERIVSFGVSGTGSWIAP